MTPPFTLPNFSRVGVLIGVDLNPLAINGTMRLGTLWALGATSGTLGALVLYDALPGINWTLWTVVTVAGLIFYRRPDAPTLRALAVPLGFAVVLAAGVSVTTTPILIVATVGIVASLMALAVLISAGDETARDYGTATILAAPIWGLARSGRGAVEAISATAETTGDPRARPALRGAILALPVVLILALLFATADPLLARLREAVYSLLGSGDAIPRVILGVFLTILVTGAYLASTMFRSENVAPQAVTSAGSRAIGLTERRIVLTAAAAMSWIFVLLQLSYLFGTIPLAIGSGVTFAEYAHRGFGELTIAASGVGLLIVAAHQRIAPDDGSRAHRALMWPSLALIGAVCCILFSAFDRISLYEDAYGFTTQRVYAQAYMLLTLVAIVVLAWHVLRDFDMRSLARSVMAVALVALTVMIFWNADAWVAQADVDRYARTGKIDIAYLTHGLSPDAYPTLVRSLARLSGSDRTQAAAWLAAEYPRRHNMGETPAWYEWNLRRARALQARTQLSSMHFQRAPASSASTTQNAVASR